MRWLLDCLERKHLVDFKIFIIIIIILYFSLNMFVFNELMLKFLIETLTL